MSPLSGRSGIVALSLVCAAFLSSPAHAGTRSLSPEVCPQSLARSPQNVVRPGEVAEACRLPSRSARRNAERLAIASGQGEPSLVAAPLPPSRYLSMLILGIGY